MASVIVQPVKTSIASLDRIQETCGWNRDYDACTVFVAYGLEASCVSRDGRPALAAKATFRPWILLHNIRQLDHEWVHIEDIRSYAEDYINELEQMRFESTTQCEAAAAEAMGSFGDRMHGFAVRSNLERHPILRRRR